MVATGWEFIQLKRRPRDRGERPGWLIQDMRFSRGKLVRLELMFDQQGFGDALVQWKHTQASSDG